MEDLNTKNKNVQKRLAKGQGAADTVSKLQKAFEELPVAEQFEQRMRYMASVKYSTELTEKFIVKLAGNRIALRITPDTFEERQEGGQKVTRFNTAIFEVAAIGPEVQNDMIVPGAYVWMNETAFAGAAKPTPWGDRQGFLVVDEGYVMGVVDGDYKEIIQPDEEFIDKYRQQYQQSTLDQQNKRRKDLNQEPYASYDEFIETLQKETDAGNDGKLQAALLSKVES